MAIEFSRVNAYQVIWREITNEAEEITGPTKKRHNILMELLYSTNDHANHTNTIS